MLKVLTGNHSAAYGAALSRVEVIPAYPITPQTQIIEKLSELVDTNQLNAKYIRVESEHSAMAACIGASAGGARAFTATSSHGLIYMAEMVFWAAASRLPIVMSVACRTLGPPWNIWNEHTDMLALRDTGWIQIFAESNQEVLDAVIQAYKIAEDNRVLLPIMIGLDAFTLSHTSEPVDVPRQETVDRFLPPRRETPFVLDPAKPLTHGNMAYPSHHMELKFMHHSALEHAAAVIAEVDCEWQKLVGRSYGGLTDEFMCDDSDVVVVTIGSSAGDAKEAARLLREKGVKAGVLRLRVIRPFPIESLRKALSRVKAVAVVDRNLSPGSGGIIVSEVKSALYGRRRQPFVKGYIVGLGGRDITVEDYTMVFEKTLSAYDEGDDRSEWVNVNLEVLGQ
ncbi:MAG: transketolase C-terminal domain-containing protein [Nitrososphaeria archaeon]